MPRAADSLAATRLPLAELEALERWLVANDPEDFGCACRMAEGKLQHECGPCTARRVQAPFRKAAAEMRAALSHPPAPRARR